MEKLTNRLKSTSRRYFRRKVRSNTRSKMLTTLPRLIVNRSNSYNYAQIIDVDWKVIASSTDMKINEWTKKEKARIVWIELAKKAIEKWKKNVVFDRNGYLYHWRIKEIAEGAREWWLIF